MTAPREDGQGPRLAMENALRHAGLKPRAVDYINAHATGTPLGDAAENRAIKDLLLGHDGKEKASDINTSSSKGAVGHLLGAAGSVEAIFTVLGMHHVSTEMSQTEQWLTSIEHASTHSQSPEPWQSTRRLYMQLRRQCCSAEKGESCVVE